MKKYGRIAVLVDFENVYNRLSAKAFSMLDEYGDVVTKAAYADWTIPAYSESPYISGLFTVLGVKFLQIFHRGQDDVDMEIIKDAIALLPSVDTICIMSNDGIYHHLASHIHGAGKQFIVVGVNQPAAVLRASADLYLDMAGYAASELFIYNKDDLRRALISAYDAVLAKRKAHLSFDNDGDSSIACYVYVTEIGAYISKHYPSFTWESLGYSRLSDALPLISDLFCVPDLAVSGAKIFPKDNAVLT